MPKDIEVILKDYVCHVIDLKAEDDPAGSGFHREFRILRELQIQNKNEDKFDCEDGKTEENIKKNRYKDIIPRDDRRVKLTEIPGQKGSDYINATFIEDVDGAYGYVAAQGPMPHTVGDFWRMLWEYNTEIIFMACRTKEENRPKCEKYWADLGKSITFSDMTVYTDSEEEIQDHFIKRHMRAVRGGEVHHLTQFHYTGWPDHNTPSSPDALRCMIESVRTFRKRLDIPMIVHCSAGCGRTGTIIAIDLAWTLLDKGMIKEEFSMFDIIKSLREQRTSMVQTPDQYEYTHMVMKSLCNEWLAAFSKHDYENVTMSDIPLEEAPPIPEQAIEKESYINIEFRGNSGDSDTAFPKEKGIEIVKASRSSKPVISEKPDFKMQQQPDKTQQQILAQQHQQQHQKEQTKLEPEVVKLIRPPAIDSAAAPKTLAISSPLLEADIGDYVQVKPAVMISPISPTIPPPILPDKKNPLSNIHNLESSAPTPEPTDLHKTVITIGGSHFQSLITKTGSVGVSAKKQQAPKPALAQVVVPSQQQLVENESLSAARDTSTKAAVKRANTENITDSNSNLIRLDSTEGAPMLPSRSYKPEEIVDSNPVPSIRQKNQYDNHNVVSQQTKIPTAFSEVQSQQPLLKTLRGPGPSGGVQVVPIRLPAQPLLISHRTIGQQPQPILTRPHVEQQEGMVRALGGQLASHSRQSGEISRKNRASSLKSSNAPQPQGMGRSYVFPSSQANPAGIVSMPTQNSGHATSVPPVQRKIQGKGFSTERARRPAGPRPQPASWSLYSKTYL